MIVLPRRTSYNLPSTPIMYTEDNLITRNPLPVIGHQKQHWEMLDRSGNLGSSSGLPDMMQASVETRIHEYAMCHIDIRLAHNKIDSKKKKKKKLFISDRTQIGLASHQMWMS
jgi:hypothetical protein